MKEAEDNTNGKIKAKFMKEEELLWLKPSYYPKQSTVSMQSLSKCETVFFTKIKQIILRHKDGQKRHEKKYPASLIIKEIQIKTTIT